MAVPESSDNGEPGEIAEEEVSHVIRSITVDQRFLGAR